MDIRQAYADARAAGATRHRDIALSLAVTEGMLIDAHVGAPDGGLQVQRLRRDFPRLLSELSRAGELMALTRNPHCVHERTGVYEHLSVQGEPGREVGLALGEDIDLRLFYSQWAHGYAVREGEQQSLQFFDARGVAVHKVFTRQATQLAAWQALRLRWTDPDAPAVEDGRAHCGRRRARDRCRRLPRRLGRAARHARVLRPAAPARPDAPHRDAPGRAAVRTARGHACRPRAARRRRGQRHAHHGLRRQPGRHPDPRRADQARRGAGPLAQCAGPALQPAPA
jgi:hypothetical protein